MRPYHIIIAEDDGATKRLLHFLLNRDIHPDSQLTLVEDGQAALLAFEQSGADLVITDFNMPVMHGIDLVRNLRAQHATVPIILHSVWAIDKEARAAGVNYFISFPFDIEELEKAVRELLPPRPS